MLEKATQKQLVTLLVLNIVTFFVHSFATKGMLEQVVPVLDLRITYLVNMITTSVIVFCILFLKDMFQTQIGFIFLGFSMLKMLFFFIFLNPSNAGNEVTSYDALAFFIPYGLNLIMELVIVVKVLNLSDLTNSKQS